MSKGVRNITGTDTTMKSYFEDQKTTIQGLMKDPLICPPRLPDCSQFLLFFFFDLSSRSRVRHPRSHWLIRQPMRARCHFLIVPIFKQLNLGLKWLFVRDEVNYIVLIFKIFGLDYSYLEIFISKLSKITKLNSCDNPI